MQRKKKIRGHTRRHKRIQQWVENAKQINMDFLNEYQRDYAEILVHPWSGISITSSFIPEPKGLTRKLMVDGLFTIYEHWEKQLMELNEPYYLAVWIFEPRFSKSQVVCAIGDMIDFYRNSFNDAGNPPDSPPQLISHMQSSVSNFSWKTALDEDIYTEDEFDTDPAEYASGEDWLADQKLYRELIRSARTEIISLEGDSLKVFNKYKGKVHIGTKN